MNSAMTRKACGLLSILFMQTLTAAEPVAGETAFAAVPVPAAESKPVTLRIGVNDIYCAKTACECIAGIAGRGYDGVIAELKKSGITLEVTYFMEVMDLDKAILAGKFDGVICKPWTALRHAPATGRDFKRVVDILDPNNVSSVRGQFVTKAGSPIKNLADIQGKRVVFGQEDAYEKHHAPLLMLAAKDIKPGESRYLSSCGENLDALMSGNADVAVISDYALTASCAVDFATPEDFKIVATTGDIPLTSLLLDMKRVSAATATRVRKAMLDISGKHTPDDLLGNGFVAPASWRPVTDAVTPAMRKATSKPKS